MTMDMPLPCDLERELEETRARLAEAEETLRALRDGEVDALLIDGPNGPRVYTLKTAAEPYRMLVEQMREGALTVSPRGIVLYCNEAFADIVGVEPRFLVGSSILDLMSRSDLDYLMAPGGRAGCEMSLRRPTGGPGAKAPVLVSSSPLIDEGMPITCLVVTDLTRQQLRVRYEAIVEATIDGVYSLTPDLIIETWNSGARRLYGYEAGEIIGRSERVLYPEGGQKALADLVEEVTRRGHAVTADEPRRRKDGSIVQVIFCLAPLRDQDGRLTGYAAVAHDITQRKAEEHTRQLLLGELNHRVKNTLAIVQSIASQTLRRARGLDDFEPSFTGRLRALSVAHNILTETAWRGANLGSLVREQLALGGAAAERYSCDGPEVWLDPHAAVRLALVLHELGTNARKHGALSVLEGRVNLAWHIERGDSIPVMKLRWAEVNGPRITPPERRGFGSLLIEQSLRADGGHAEMLFNPDGLLCTFEIPLREGMLDSGAAASGEVAT
jgi:PAS domain S-box-containing protein